MPPRRTRQTKLDFTPAKKRKLDDSDSDVPLPTPKRTFKANNTPAKKERSGNIRSSMRIMPKGQGMFGSSDIEGASSSSSAESVELTGRVNRGGKKNKEKEQIPRKGAKKASILDDDNESEDVAAPRRARTRGQTASKPIKLSSTENSVVGRQSSPEESSESDVPVVTPRRIARRKPVEMSESSTDEIAPPSGRRRKIRRRDASTEEDEENDSDENEQGGNDHTKGRNRQEVDDLAEDLSFLQSSPPPEKGRLRSTQVKPLDKKQKLLQELRRKRAGASSVTEPSSSATSKRRRPVALPDSDSELEIIKEEDGEFVVVDDSVEDASNASDEIEDSNQEDEPTPRRRTTNALDMFQEDMDDEEFIDDDPDANLGEPADISEALPIHLSRWRTAKPNELFPIAIEWMVMKKINPAFDAQNELYRLAFDKLDGEVAGLADSKYSSSVWTQDFSRALKARPGISITDIGVVHGSFNSLSETGCEACNRKSHKASFNVTFSGAPYHPSTLEPLARNARPSSDSSSSSNSDSDSDSSSNSDNDDDDGPALDRDQNGAELVSEDHVFALGSTCKANAQMAHTLRHWRWHLNSLVVHWLSGEGYLEDKKVIKREKKSTARREKEARKIVKKMDESGEIRVLQKMYKAQVQYAHEAENEYKKGWGRR